jgi:hypothetical protein
MATTTILGKEINALSATSASFASTAQTLLGSVVSASYALTASFALNGGGGAAFPYTGSAQITGSLGITGSISVSGSIIARSSTATANALARWSGSASGPLTLTGSILNSNNNSVYIGGTPASTTLVSLYPPTASITTGLLVNQAYWSTVGTGIDSRGTTTGILAVGGGTGTTPTSYGGQFQGIDGTTAAYGVYSTVYTSEYGSIGDGIGGYFDATGNGGYALPTNAYSVQLVDGTEGVGKVLVSQTSDGKANWAQTVPSASFAQTASFVSGSIRGSGTIGSIAKFSGTATIANATADTDYLINSVNTIAYTAMGSTIKGNGVAVEKPHNMTANGSLTAGTVFFIAYYLPKAETITGVKWFQGTTAAGSSGSFGLYSVSGGTITRQASSSFDTTVFSTSQNTFKSKAFTSTYAAPAGLYYIGVISGGATGIIGNISAFNAAIYGADFTNTNRVAASVVTSSLPATQALSGTSAVQSAFGLFLY